VLSRLGARRLRVEILWKSGQMGPFFGLFPRHVGVSYCSIVYQQGGTLASASQVYLSTLSDQACSGGTGGCAVRASLSALQYREVKLFYAHKRFIQ
jgi:hypothetical protein